MVSVTKWKCPTDTFRIFFNIVISSAGLRSRLTLIKVASLNIIRYDENHEPYAVLHCRTILYILEKTFQLVLSVMITVNVNGREYIYKIIYLMSKH